TLPRVLIADDDEDLLEYLMLSLGDKYEMFTAIDGLEVVKFADTLEPDIFILDAMMPRMTGYQVCLVLKKSERFANVPIIIISAKASRNDVEYVKRLGVRAFIPKPFDFMQLDNAIVRIVRDHYFEIKPKQHTYEEILKIREDQVAKNAEKDKDRKHRETRSILKDFLSQNPDAQ
ncbi:MAG TPA: response regulator, partial [Candidatus Sumerlaeota bacterium]|nr:response regulator [Candidatus Sumerlaeota bacterium]